MKNKTKSMIFSALFAALVCVATLMLQIPLPIGGFVHLGDGVTLLCGWLLGPLWGGLAAAVGGMLADLFSGFAIYAPATFLIKGGMAVLVYFLYRAFRKLHFAALIVGSILAEILMILGYFVYEATVCGYGLGALANLFGNGLQGVFGVVSGVILLEVLHRTKLTQKIGIKKGIFENDRND